MRRVLVSGIGGAVGTELARDLASLPPDVQVVGLFSRAESAERFAALAGAAAAARVRPLVCDLTDPAAVARSGEQLGPAGEAVGVHLAADVSWQRSLDEVLELNVNGARRFAELLAATARRGRLVYVSSAYTRMAGWRYRNAYEESKALAERALRAEHAALRPSTFSCSLVVGDSRTGRISRFHGVYPLLRMVNARIPFLVGDGDQPIDVVPVDWVAQELGHVVRAALADEPPLDVVASAGERADTLVRLIALYRERLSALRVAAGRRPLEELPVISFRRWGFLRRTLDAWQVQGIDREQFDRFGRLLEVYRPYLEDARALPPANVRRPAPVAESYVDAVVRFWWDAQAAAPAAAAPDAVGVA